MPINLSTYTFNEWLDFIFKHPVTSLPFSWSFEEEWQYECDSNILITFMSQLFSAPECLIKKYNYAEIDQGFWFIPGPNGFIWTLLDENVDWLKRKECIYSIQHLFSHLFSKHNIGTSGYMWWDSVISYCVYNEKNLETELDVLEAIIVTLKKILQQNSEISIESAEHGIEHILKLAKETNSILVKQLVAKHF